MKPQPIDPLFRVELVTQTPNPQQLVWLSAHQCVYDGAAIDDNCPSESKAGTYAIKHLLAGNRGHFSPFEAPQISFNMIDFPHSVMQQITRHRIGVHFSVQSFRYTGQRLVDVANRLRDTSPLDRETCRDIVDSVVYLRPVGSYTDRQGKRYDYTEQRRMQHVRCVMDALEQYADDIAYGMSEEHARGMIPFDVRQSWVMSMNLRSLMAIMLIRGKADAQLEIQQLCQLTLPHFQAWCPEIFAWFMENLWQKGRLSP